MTGLNSVLDPRTVAVIGASPDAEKLGGRPLAYLRRYGFAGEVAAVNPKHESVQGYACYPSAVELPWAPDLAVITLPAESVVAAVQDLAERGCGAAVVFANGFAETGRDDRQRALVAAAARGGIRVVGPNCLGVVNTATGLCASFSSFLKRRMFTNGNVALVTQSGAVGNAILLSLESHGVGISTWVATGNEADLSVLDFVDELLDDTETHTVACFAESFVDGARWVDVGSRAMQRGKRLVVLKGGASGRSADLAASHTGKIVGSYRAWREIAADLGIVTPETLEELADTLLVAQTLDRGGARPPSEPELGIVVSSGGLGLLMTDECDRRGVPLAELSEETVARLREALPAAATVRNPIDPTPVSDATYLDALEILLSDANVAIGMVILNSLSRDLSYCVARLERMRALPAPGKTIAVSYFSSGDRLPEQEERRLRDVAIVVLPDPVRVIRALGLLARAEVTPARSRGSLAIESGGPPDDVLDWESAAELLRASGVDVVKSLVVRSAEEALGFWRGCAGPIALKLDDPALAHKSELGAVVLGVDGETAVRAQFTAMTARRQSEPGVVVAQRQEASGVEVLVACSRDPELGPLVTVGWGGILAEVVRDVATATCPIGVDAARRLVERTRTGVVLQGVRGARPRDVAALTRLISAVSSVFAATPELRELELNPVIVGEHGAVAVDILAVRQRALAMPASEP